MSIPIATMADVDAIAAISRAARSEAMPWLPVLHSVAEDRRFFAQRVTALENVVLAEVGGEIAGFMARDGEWVALARV